MAEADRLVAERAQARGDTLQVRAGQRPRGGHVDPIDQVEREVVQSLGDPRLERGGVHRRTLVVARRERSRRRAQRRECLRVDRIHRAAPVGRPR